MHAKILPHFRHLQNLLHLLVLELPFPQGYVIGVTNVAMVLLILYILVQILERASAFPDHYQDNTTALFSHKLLSTPLCNRENLDMSDTCPNSYELNLLIKRCGFECPPEEKPDCVNTQQGGSAYVCLPKNLTCDKGVRRIGWVDENFQNLIVIEEICPSGRFQAYHSDCFHACTAEHLQLKNIPDTFIVFSEGDSISPTYVYCNYQEGYFNTKNITLLNYDQDSMHNPYFCQHVNFSNPCEKGQEVLGNGTCVLPCEPGMCRDDHDNFICKPNCSVGVSTNVKVTTIPVTTQQNDDKTTSQVEEEETEEKNDNAVSRIVVIVAVVGGTVSILVLIGFFYLVIVRSQRKGPLKLTTINTYKNGGTTIKAGRDVYYCTNCKEDCTEQMELNNGTTYVETNKLMQLKSSDGENTVTEETAVKILDEE